jgi:hypothetical protein
MARIAYILLCHKNPDAVVAQARQLTAAGDCVAIHFDARAPKGRLRPHPRGAARRIPPSPSPAA